MSEMSDLCPETAGEGMKSLWPELVGKRGEEAKEIIERENTKVTANIIPENAIVLAVIICDNVYVRVNDYGIVTQTPGVG
ncbi:Proteinase inhibitor [Cardamine amara subsp. amara]|uniref:Proteinase inhibitor n=1 Tax=Cardamine amara subsp. amara TaxID=228776 RepID=A0ABD0ZA00_CARAN